MQNQSLNIDLSTNSSQENLIQKGDYMTVNVLGLKVTSHAVTNTSQIAVAPQSSGAKKFPTKTKL